MNATQSETMAVVVQVPREKLIDAIEVGMIGGPHGYGYWCNDVRISIEGREVVDGASANQVAEHVLGGGEAIVHEIGDDNEHFDGEDADDVLHTLTLAKLLAGYALYLAEGARYDEIDAPASDQIMQYAIFGEQKYG